MMDDEERIQHAASDGFYAILDTLGIDLNFSQIIDESFPLVFDAVVALAVGLSGARWVSRMRQSDAGGSGTGMERGVVSIPAPGATSLSSTLSTTISNASTASGKSIRGNKALGRVSGEHRVATAVLTGQARRVVASKSTRRNGRRATAPQEWANDKR
jgi:hypothetical protein